MTRIVVLGESLTSGHGISKSLSFPAILQEMAEEQALSWVVVNHGVSGETSAGGLRRVDAALRGDVKLLVLALGVNDGLRGIPVPQVKANLSAIIRCATARQIPVLLCRMEALPFYGAAYVSAFRNMYDELAAEHDVALAPFILTGVLGNSSLMQRDLIHPNPAGARAIARALWPHVQAALARSGSRVSG